jgi:hypothetical protein
METPSSGKSDSDSNTTPMISVGVAAKANVAQRDSIQIIRELIFHNLENCGREKVLAAPKILY